MARVPVCANCFYCIERTKDKYKDYIDGICRRYPPQMTYEPQAYPRSSWPVVRGIDWCGEWKEI